MCYVITYVNITEEKRCHYVIVILNIGRDTYMFILCNFCTLYMQKSKDTYMFINIEIETETEANMSIQVKF